MKQDIKLDRSQDEQFKSIMVGMAFIDKMVEQGYSVDKAFAILEMKLGIK